MADLGPALSITSVNSNYLKLQRERIREYLDIQNETSSVRAAREVLACARRADDR